MGTDHPFWLRPCRTVVLAAVAIFVTAVPATAQHSGDSLPLTFESASVKPAASALPGGSRGRIHLQRDGVFSATAVTLRELIEYAYQRHPFDRREVTGGPAWTDSARFDILATAADEHSIDPDGAPRKTWAMLRALLTQRFRLQVDEEKKHRPVYLLVPASSPGQLGPRIQRSAVDCGALLRGDAQPPGAGHRPSCAMKTPPGRLFATTVIMPTLATLLSSHLDRPVIDSTGLVGRFDVELEAAEIKAPPGYTPGPSDLALPPSAGPSIFVAVREQLGLKLHAQVAPVSVLVIRRAERPAPD
jgi:uncharacterized protein (TIGR03435 family)